MQDINLSNITLDQLFLPEFTAKNIEVSVLRLDEIHPVISGNKWFKLRYYLEEANQQNKKTVVNLCFCYMLSASVLECQLLDNEQSPKPIVRFTTNALGL